MLMEFLNASLKAGDPTAAKRLCEERLRSTPDDPDAHRYLSQLHSVFGEHEQAVALATRATELAPQDPRTWSDLGRVHVLSRRLSEGIACFQRAVELDPCYADGWHNLGLAFKQSGEQQQAFDALKQALLIDPARAETYLTLGNLLVDAEQLEDAIGCFERAIAADPALARAHSRLAQELSLRGEVERAAALHRRSLSIDPDNVQGWIDLGRTLEDLGQRETALSCYRHVLRRQPGHTFALSQYLAMVKDDEGLDWIPQMEAALDRPENAEEGKALIGYGLVKFYDRRGQWREAACAGLKANTARRKVAGSLDRDALRVRVDAMATAYPAEFFAERQHMGLGTDQPVFIVGLPRSGTTLTEQILSAHPLMHGAGELPDLARLARKVVAEHEMAPWQAAWQLTDEMTGRRIANEYLQALRHGADHDQHRISDKQPLNFFHLAFAGLLFPNARVIHCRRDVRDNALSIWMENFNPDQQYATDFEDLAYFMAQYRRLMTHWRTALPLQILDVQYEDIVADLEGQAKRLMAFLKVPWDERCLDFHQAERAVQTPSRWQVRQPIYTKSVGRWKTYREYLPALDTAFR
ncbi:sulfotransferase [Nitrospira sp. KM1]|uniref:tetratricopeptide repeat-containing sulfotransferase family protein n=1 Tax=Nitrospira sp. KM1 TaxID=1936990 RepID=UPI0013A748F3|nr:tetratricopeptide repeat-containing sulfotransferase family protein [Nitrospira sp. KM1]BCA52866.1 sulfotransferase [Nitrospira sp. KM1]